VTLTPSIHQPPAETLSSLTIRQRSATLCPAAAAGSFTVVVTNPLELPPQACRPAITLPEPSAMVASYPPATNDPPASRMSWNTPPSILISSTPPS
jgi:hypothetical protein